MYIYVYIYICIYIYMCGVCVYIYIYIYIYIYTCVSQIFHNDAVKETSNTLHAINQIMPIKQSRISFHTYHINIISVYTI